MLYVAAIFTSIYAGVHVSPWFAQHFLETGSTFEWLQNQMLGETHPVGLVARVVPAMPTSSGLYAGAYWIALHVLQAFMTIFMAGAIFMLFVAVEYLMVALWDDERATLIRGDKALANMAGVIAGIATAFMTMWFLASLSWMSAFKGMATAINQSMLLQGANYILSVLPGLHIML